MHSYLMRSRSESSIGDVSAVTAILAAWLLTIGFRRPSMTAASIARVTMTALIGVATVYMALVGTGGFMVKVFAEDLVDEGPGLFTRKIATAERLTPPFDGPAAQYVAACTEPADRILLTWYAPEIQFGLDRGFAAGRPYFLTSFAPSDASVAFSLNRLKQESVPLVFVGPDYDSEFSRAFRPINEYLLEHYRPVGEVAVNEGTVRVLADERRTRVSTYRETGLPCFR
jgi:hypothetical protein